MARAAFEILPFYSSSRGQLIGAALNQERFPPGIFILLLSPLMCTLNPVLIRIFFTSAWETALIESRNRKKTGENMCHEEPKYDVEMAVPTTVNLVVRRESTFWLLVV